MSPDPTADQIAFATERATALRAMADLIEAKPTLAGSEYGQVRIDIWCDTADDMAGLVRQLGGAREKKALGDIFVVARDFGGGVSLEVNANRDEVCEAVVVGTETVEVPDPTVVVPKVTVERDVIEWRCAPVLVPAVGVADARASLAGVR